MIKVSFINNMIKEYNENTKIIDIKSDYEPYMNNPILGCKINNEIMPMDYKLTKDSLVEFLDVLDNNGYKMYQAGLKYIFIEAIKEIYGSDTEVNFLHSIAHGIVASVNASIREEDTFKIIDTMNSLIKADIPFIRYSVDKKDAINYYHKIGEEEKALNIKNINTDVISLYKFKNNINYFYTKMPYSTKVINKFNLKYLGDNNFVLQYPSKSTNGNILDYVLYENVIKCFNRDTNWLNLLKVNYASDVNNLVKDNLVSPFIRTSELDFNNRLLEIANSISLSDNIKLVAIAGPSSSGKTTTSKKLGYNLRSKGLEPVNISLDDYYLPLDDRRILEDGTKDLESINALDLVKFNEDLTSLLAGNLIDLPTYNFVTGKREYHGKKAKLKENSIIIIEGLHALNPELITSINKENIYRIYLSPFIALKIDRHNYISTIDLRCLRRIIRDYLTRGKGVHDTLESWEHVKDGERNYIYPFINEADIVLNTALPYELGVLKVYVEPLLLSVNIDSVYYEETRRLLDFLKIFYSISSELVPNDSIIREFIGGSIFKEEL